MTLNNCLIHSMCMVHSWTVKLIALKISTWLWQCKNISEVRGMFNLSKNIQIHISSHGTLGIVWYSNLVLE